MASHVSGNRRTYRHLLPRRPRLRLPVRQSFASPRHRCHYRLSCDYLRFRKPPAHRRRKNRPYHAASCLIHPTRFDIAATRKQRRLSRRRHRSPILLFRFVRTAERPSLPPMLLRVSAPMRYRGKTASIYTPYRLLHYHCVLFRNMASQHERKDIIGQKFADSPTLTSEPRRVPDCSRPSANGPNPQCPSAVSDESNAHCAWK